MATNSKEIFVDHCIDTESINIIREFLDNFNRPNVFRGKYRDVDVFFKEIEFNTYLVKYVSRMSKEQKNNVSGSDFEEERMNQDCLMYANRLNTLAKKNTINLLHYQKNIKKKGINIKNHRHGKYFFKKEQKKNMKK